jgi:hypothetical protein
MAKKRMRPIKGTIKHQKYALFGHEVMQRLEEHNTSTKIVQHDWGNTSAIDDIGGSVEEVLGILHLDIRELAIKHGLLKP